MLRTMCGGCLVVLVFLSPVRAADPPAIKTGFDLIPINAAAGIGVHSLEDLKTEGDRFVKNAGLEKNLNNARPSQLLSIAFSYVGLHRGRDDRLPAGIFLANLIESRILSPSRIRDIEKLLVVAVGIEDRNQMASNFGLAQGELQSEKIIKISTENRSFGQFIYVKGKHLYLGNNERAILSVVQGKPLSQALPKKVLDRFRRSDLLLHLGTSPWGPAWAAAVQRERERVRELQKEKADPQTGLRGEMLELMADSLPAVQNAILGAAIDNEGLEFGAMVVFRPEDHPAARRFLELLAAGKDASSLAGLPRGDLVAAQAVRSDGSTNRDLVTAMVANLTHFWIDKQKLASVTEPPKFVGLFDEVWHRLQGSRAAVYRNGNPGSDGLFSIVAVLDTSDPKQFLQEMRQLARFAKPGEMKLEGGDRSEEDVAAVEKLIQELGDSNFRVRQSATLKLRLLGAPALPYLENALKSSDREVVVRARRIRQQIERTIETRRRDVLMQKLLGNLSVRCGDFPRAETRQGRPIDIVKMELEGDSQAAEARLKETFGPEWSKIRLAVVDQKIVVLLGSNLDLLDETMENLQHQKPGLAEHPELKEFRSRASGRRRVEFHAMLAQVLPLVQKTPADESPASDLTSLSLAVDNETIEVHLWIPNSEIKAVTRLR